MTTKNAPAFGLQIKEKDIIAGFLTGPGEFLVARTLEQLASVPAFKALFGAYKPLKDPVTGLPVGADDNQRWSDYAKWDWNMRALPAISVYEADTEDKTSDQAWLNGTVNIMVLWPPSQRRSDWARVPMAFKGALQGFFASDWVRDMLDEIYHIQRPMKVPGLNEYGKVMVWSPNVEGIVDGEQVPVTLVGVKYRIDLRAWYRAMEFDNRTKGNPFERTLADLTTIGGEYDGVSEADADNIDVVIHDVIPVENP